MVNLLSGVGFITVVLGLGAYLATNLVPKNGPLKLGTRIKIREGGALAFLVGMILLIVSDMILGYWTGVVALTLLLFMIPMFIIALTWADGRRARILK